KGCRASPSGCGSRRHAGSAGTTSPSDSCAWPRSTTISSSCPPRTPSSCGSGSSAPRPRPPRERSSTGTPSGSSSDREPLRLLIGVPVQVLDQRPEGPPPVGQRVLLVGVHLGEGPAVALH